MPEELYALTPNDLETLRTVKRLIQNGKLNTSGRDEAKNGVSQSPDVYIAKTPTGGIPGRVSLTPGSAECEVYVLVDGVLEALGIEVQTVYNLGTTAIEGNLYIAIKQDKFRIWLADVPGLGITGYTGNRVIIEGVLCTGGVLVTTYHTYSFVNGVLTDVT